MVVLVCTLAAVVLNTRYLGQEGQGGIALINLGILILVSISNIIGGGALVYLIPRMGVARVTAPAILWSLFSSALGMMILKLFNFVDPKFVIHVGILGLLQSLFFFVHQIILSRERIRMYNSLLALQTISLLISMFVVYQLLDQASVSSFILCLYISFGTTLLASVLCVRDVLVLRFESGIFRDILQIFRHGFYAQGGNVIHLLNQRGGLYLLQASLFSAGIFSLCLYAAEAIWNVSKSISLVQHSRISNLSDKSVIRSLTISFTKLSVLFTAPFVLMAVSIPDSWFRFIFGDDLVGLHHALLLFSPAILLHSVTLVFSHYFSGTGLHKHNMWGAALGFIVLISLGAWLTMLYGLNGTVMAASAGWLTNFIYHLIQFHRLECLTIKDFRLRREDLAVIRGHNRS
jgi:O-antigen/teichoic acid export membrane protein